tara:strand:- start:49006 stop:49197 length:192 start_codon:yes stop_codon:yes gene_type:complete
MEKKTYTVMADAPRLGLAGTTVQMTERQARYLVRAGNLAEGIVKLPTQSDDTSAAPKRKAKKD